ncbi:MAG: ribonuclease [Clostridia bacterium]|nr:ribonuclease [Clostridia bacterium]
MIKEIIVVEGKNDAAAVKRAVDAEIIITSGFGLTKQTLELIRKAQQNQGVIVLTDPDFMGEKIRKIISDRIKGIKHAFIPAEDAEFENDIGIENAKPEAILKALSMAKAESSEKRIEFTILDMTEYALVGLPESSARRRKLGAALGIGYANAKQFLNRLNIYGITRQEFEAACNSLFE